MQEVLNVLGHQLAVISGFGDNIFVWSTALVVLILFLLIKDHDHTALVSVMIILSYVYSVILKLIFRVERPNSAFIENYNAFDYFSFPSSHVVYYTVFWGFIIYITHKYLKESRLFMMVLRSLALYFLITVGISRVYLGMHYTLDVLGGYFFGGIFLSVLILIDIFLEEKLSKNKNKNN